MAELTRGELDAFLTALARGLPCPARLVLTGGAQALLLGGARPTADIDFELSVPPRHAGRWDDVERLVVAAARRLGVVVQFAADIDRWSSVSVPLALRRTRPYRRIGKLSVRLLDARCWAVYKLARYLQADIEDLIVVLRHEAVRWQSLAALCGVSLRASPRSTQLRLFRGQVEHFFREHGASVWGREFDAEGAVTRFRHAAGIAGG